MHPEQRKYEDTVLSILGDLELPFDVEAQRDLSSESPIRARP
jgi:hypothetical protein